MKRLALVLSIAALLAMPGATLAFHHGGLPSTQCAADAADSPSNNNGEAKAGLSHNPTGLPLPPLGSPGNSGMSSTPGNGQGDGGEHCANASG
jgi:hypothetical protein